MRIFVVDIIFVTTILNTFEFLGQKEEKNTIFCLQTFNIESPQYVQGIIKFSLNWPKDRSVYKLVFSFISVSVFGSVPSPGSRKVTSSASSAWSRLAISEPLQSKMYVFLGTA